eukprot:jgi/Chlat1/423/Chrsp102S00939
MEVDDEDEEGCNQQPTTAAAVVDLVGSDDDIMVLDDPVSNPQPSTPQPLFIYPSASARDAVPVLETDRRLLDGRQELNDTILHFFCRYKEEEILGRADGIQVKLFHPHFYTKNVRYHRQNDWHTSNHRIDRWESDPFAKDLLGVIVNPDTRTHWSLLLVCNPGGQLGSDTPPLLVHLDSLGLHRNVDGPMRAYLYYMWGRKHGSDSQRRFSPENVPQRKDGVACGLFVMLYLDKFIDGVQAGPIVPNARIFQQVEKTIANTHGQYVSTAKT